MSDPTQPDPNITLGIRVAAALVRMVADEQLLPAHAAQCLRGAGFAPIPDAEQVLADAAEQLIKADRLFADVDALWLYLDPFELEHIPGHALGGFADELAGFARADFERAVLRLAQPDPSAVAA